MMEIDWDGTIEAAHVSPRGILSEWLGREDEIKMIAITTVLFDGEIHVSWSWRGEEMSSMYVLGMLESAKAYVAKRQQDGP